MRVQSTGPAPPPPRAIQLVAHRIRLHAVRMVARQGLGYLGQALSSAELMATLFTSYLRSGLDHFVLSPGHYVIAAYAAAAESGLLDPADLDAYGQDGSDLEAIGTERSPVADITCGSLGQGLSAAAGLALSDRLRGIQVETYALVSDGEVQEGQTWEAAMFAAHHGLDRLVVLLDCNNSQVDGPVDSVSTIEPLPAKWEAFGWTTQRVDGHDPGALVAALDQAVASPKPAVVLADTSTRHGLDCLPADADGHFIKLPTDLADRAVAELETAILEAEAAVR
ncbi:MAG TPA: 1-deoxy-D-xylulose-5-phosphate synthase N-terminal domain-containing protein [Actinomycetes bacterium]|nr:1-deoxy-D-xylulose-5-phosphate synthase N-terminal domain-containing protein [Actinomycetes bacterium]